MLFQFNRLRNLLLLLTMIILCGTKTHAQTNEGRVFWFGFMEHIDVNNNEKVAMITSKFNTTGTISVPNKNWSQDFTVSANNVTIITLPKFTENIGSEVYNNVGVKIVSDEPTSVYIHQYHEYRSEATVVLPASSLGKSYYAMTYRGVLNRETIYPAEFLVVGTENETSIEITLADESAQGKSKGSTFEIILDKGETYQVQASTASGDLTGSKLVGDKNFALFAGNSWTEVPNGCSARDNLLEQMYPLETWGNKFVTVPNAQVSFDVVRILASENNTLFKIFGKNTLIEKTINRGEFEEYSFSEAKYILSNKPIQVAQFNVGENCGGYFIGDPSMVLLNSVEQTRDTVTLYNSSLQEIVENYINIISLTSDVPFIMFDGAPIPPEAEIGTVGLNDEYSYIRLRVSSGAHTIISEACGIIATAYGYGSAESYAYSGGASFNAINVNPIPEGGCLNDTIVFDTKLPDIRYSFHWDLGNGSTSTLSTFEEFYPDLGSYPIELIVTDDCLGTVDTFRKDLVISLRQAVSTIGDTIVCENNSFELGAIDIAGAKYVWNGPDEFYSEEQFPMISEADIDMQGTYSVIGIVSGCATFPNFSEVGIWELPQPNLGPDTIFCNIGFETRLDPGDFSEYLWQNNSFDPDLEILEDGEYWVEVSDENGCVSRDSIVLEELCPTEVFIPNAFSPNEDGINDKFEVYGHDIISMHLRIYDRWGNFIFELKDIDSTWDGRMNGQQSKTGLYVWTLQIKGYRANGEIYNDTMNGDFYLMR